MTGPGKFALGAWIALAVVSIAFIAVTAIL